MKVLTRSIVLTIAVTLATATAAVAQEAQTAGETPSAAAEEFLRAAADSNVGRMGELFGTDKGSAARTGKPDDWGMRAVVVQAAFDGIIVKAIAETPSGRKDHVLVSTELARGNCKVVIPITTVKSKEGWLVRAFDWTAAWDGVNRPCMTGGN